MKKLPFNTLLSFLLILLVASCQQPEQEAPEQEAPEQDAAKQALTEEELGGYTHGVAVKDMRFLWKLRQDSIDIKVAARTKGWVGIGLNPETAENMKGANFIIGYVRGGKAKAFDHYGLEENKHKDDENIGGKIDFSDLSGSERDGQTEIEFTVPLDSGDPMDTPLSLGDDNTILLAYGRSDSIALKHRFRAVLKVNLSTGTYSVLKIK